ncbi:hypothetical protein M4I21_01510 [Cellulophaga sp. 20_2_10]|uniref:hypothetical protein n=1 Tax=Cellulophaga sp. 20_2_10 TaxID=2942476 RepID=UPI00201AA9BF|nr:hypothetical protein [Cellulophaga sp. 20_2_10]MCL5244466.1 hypothetical protein [Cellulophaga sp. 20_2_10]
MKKIKKIVNWIFGGISLIYILILMFPSFLFANKLDYKNFSVHYHSNAISTEQLKLVLDESEKLLKSSELFKTEINQDIFICNNFNEFTFFALFSRKAFAINYPITQNIFLSKSSISDNVIFRNAKENNKRTVSGVIAHETVHSLLENKLGSFKCKLLPSWKSEGYCDFIANESSFNKEKGLEDICNDKEDIDDPSFKYFKFRMVTAYLLKERKIGIDKFLYDDFDLEEINPDLKKKYCKK